MVAIMNDDPNSLIYMHKLQPALDIGVDYFNELNKKRGLKLIKYSIVYHIETKSNNSAITTRRNNFSESGQPTRPPEYSNFERKLGGTFTPSKEEENCLPALAIGGLADLKYRIPLSFIVGPPCTRDMIVVAPVASYYHLPICTGYSIFEFLDIRKFKTITRLSYRSRGQINALDLVLKHYNHREVVIISDIKWNRALELVGRLTTTFRSDPYYLLVNAIYFDSNQEASFVPAEFLEDVKDIAKGVILLMEYGKMRNILLLADKKDMSKGKYLFLTIELYPENLLQNFIWSKGDKDDYVARRVYNSLLVISLKVWKDEKWYKFNREMKIRALKDYDYYYNGDVNYFIGAFHDCLVMYALTLNSSGDSSSKIVPDKFWNSSFEGVTGKINLDEFGDRQADFSIYGMVNRHSGIFKEVAIYRSKEFRLQFVDNVDWIKGPPLGMAICTMFNPVTKLNESHRCHKIKRLKRSKYLPMVIMLISLSVIVVFIVAIFSSVYLIKSKNANRLLDKSLRYKRSIKEVIAEGLLCFVTIGFSFSSSRFDPSFYGSYQGNIVFIKKVEMSERMEINNKILQEIRHIKVISHDNLSTFMGICYDKNYFCVVTKFVSKLNLTELLAKETLQLDLIIQYSIINDIIKGMLYLHSSPIGCHGRLTTSQIIVDNRFSAKITGFGLPTFYEEYLRKDVIREDISAFVVKHLLWVAPEHLRKIVPIIVACHADSLNKNVNLIHQLSANTKQGDIYSFAIILSEIATRRPPFYYNFLETLNGTEVSNTTLSPDSTLTLKDLDRDVNPFEIFLSSSRHQYNSNPTSHGQNYKYIKFLQKSVMDKLLKVRRRPPYRPFLEFHSSASFSHSRNGSAGELGENKDKNSVSSSLSGLRPRRLSSIITDCSSTLENDGKQIAVYSRRNSCVNIPLRPRNPWSPLHPQIKINNKKVRVLIDICWEENPKNRPSFVSILDVFKSLTKRINFNNIIDSLLEKLEEYTVTLEELVGQKTKDFAKEKERVDLYLFEILPKPIAMDLKMGIKVVPEEFRNVTVYFSDIVNFTHLSAISTPIEIVDFLSELYCCFDGIAEKLDVYKVETIGDAYMVVSGLPKRNGNRHVREICRFALAIRDNISHIKHPKDDKLEIRIGIHTGSCAAGIVGLKMPRYCLFGNTIIMASKMESKGEAMKIHISQASKEALEDFRNFRIEERGFIEIQDKGMIKTYWLLGESK
ncbi:atrial natriuretic peptide receptor 1-like [Gordionus sp. m RMFG-2023]|uniref:atrial natriuretic peptide receptor 1-like n=1 Tax=Gordionus sp. m RMFG-2023 TaxID=3053472 RepID=UPI0031FC9B25